MLCENLRIDDIIGFCLSQCLFFIIVISCRLLLTLLVNSLLGKE